MRALNILEISNVIHEFIAETKNPALFAGAGVAARVGFPTWDQFMAHLACVADRFDPLTAQLIRQRSASGQYLDA